jgi:hypothetical protein
MFWNRKKSNDHRLDRAAASLIRRAAMSDQEIEGVASRMQFAGVRARIRARQPDNTGDGWMTAMMAAQRAIPAMAILTLAVVFWFWFAGAGAQESASLDTALTGAGGAGVERVRSGGTCAISTSDECAISTEDVLATMVKEAEK